MELFEKLCQMQEVSARGGKIIAISDFEVLKEFTKIAEKKLEIPPVSGLIQRSFGANCIN